MAKKILWAALLLVLTLACTGGSEFGNNNQALVTVHNRPMYEALGILDDMTEALANGSYIITDTLLVYDSAGQLVSKSGTETSSLEPHFFNVPMLGKGSFTVISVQTARSASAKAPRWTLANTDKLSTVSLMAPGTPIPAAMAIGMAAATVSGEYFTYPLVSHESLGSIVDFKVDGFTAESGYISTSIWGMRYQHSLGIYLDPSRNGDSRWIMDPEQEAANNLCTLDPGQAEGKFFTLTHGDDIALQFWADTPDSENLTYTLTDLKLEAGKQYLCYIDLAKTLRQTPFFGAPSAFVLWKTARDAGILVADPYLQWGSDIAAVDRHVKSKLWYIDGNAELEYWEEDFASWHKWYYVARGLTEQYLFETEDGRNLRHVMVVCWHDELSIDIPNNWLLKTGYTYKGKGTRPDDLETYDLFVSADGKTDAYTASEEVDDCWYIIFEPHV